MGICLGALISSSETRNTLLSVLADRELILTMNRFPGFEAMHHQVGQPPGPGQRPGASEPDARAVGRLAASQERDFKLLCLDDGIVPMNGNRYHQMALESRNRGIAESRNRGIAESRNRGIAESRFRREESHASADLPLSRSGEIYFLSLFERPFPHGADGGAAARRRGRCPRLRHHGTLVGDADGQDVLNVAKGCDNGTRGARCRTSSILTDDDFTLDGTTYHIEVLWLRNNNLTINFDTDLATAAQSLILEIDGTNFAFEDASQKGDDVRVWNSSGLTWSVGDDVAVKLKSVDETAPTFSSAEVTAATPKLLAITFDEALDTVRCPRQPRSRSRLTDGCGHPDQCQYLRRGGDADPCDGAGCQPVECDNRLHQAASNPLQDASDNEVATFTGQSVTNNAPPARRGNPVMPSGRRA